MSDPEPTKTISGYEAKLNKADLKVVGFSSDDQSILRSLRSLLREHPTIIPALILFISVMVFGTIAPRFMTPYALSTVLQQVTVVGLVALAQTLIILTAGIDLSVGAALVIASLVMGKLAVFAGVPTIFAVSAGIFAGGMMGAFNGFLVAVVRLPPFIVTLGTLQIFTALKLWYSGSESIRNLDIEQTAPFLLWFGKAFSAFGARVTYGGISLFLMALVFWYILSKTAWGRHVHALGDDPDAALLSGINPAKTIISVYTVSGLILGFAAWVAVGRVGTISPIAFEKVNLESITAVVIGGTSLFGGRGSIIGSVLGAFIVGVFMTGLTLAGVDDYWQLFAVGALVLVAVALDQWLRRASQ